MIGFFAHLSLAEQLLADLSFPDFFAVISYGDKRARHMEENSDSDIRCERKAWITASVGFAAMIALTIYCHVSH